MKYFIDTEFKEYFKQHNFIGIPVGYPTPTIDLISIGIVSEDKREYYALNKECDLDEIWEDKWLNKNVLHPIYLEYIHGDMRNVSIFSKSSVKAIFYGFGKSKTQITSDIISMVNCTEQTYDYGIGLNKVIESITKSDCWSENYYKNEFEYIKKHNTFIPKQIYSSGMDGLGVSRNKDIIYNQPEFYAYYASYDWVVFCQLFGRMLDLPKGFPMYCKDLKQIMDDKGLDKEWKRLNCPDPYAEHNALIDAKWNLDLYNAINFHK
jgi:hypothetical protein